MFHRLHVLALASPSVKLLLRMWNTPVVVKKIHEYDKDSHLFDEKTVLIYIYPIYDI